MNRDGKALATFIGLIIVLGVFAWLMGTAERVSPFLWLIPAAIAIVATVIPIRYPNTRFAYVKAWHGILEGFDALINEASGGRYGRQAIKKDVKSYVRNRNRNRCQYPRCPVDNPRLLEIHHIDLNPSRSDDVTNLILVCRNHHKRIQDDGVAPQKVRDWALNNTTLESKGKRIAGTRG